MALGCTTPSWPEGQTGDFGLIPPMAPYGGIIPISLMQQPWTHKRRLCNGLVTTTNQASCRGLQSQPAHPERQRALSGAHFVHVGGQGLRVPGGSHESTVLMDPDAPHVIPPEGV